MRGTVYRQCWCRDPATGKKLHGNCPQLGKRGHGRWYARYEAPKAPGERRRQPVLGPFDTKVHAEEELADALARIGGGGHVPDRSVHVAAYLDGYLAGKVNLKARTLATDTEAFALYWKPALGHMRMVDVRARHVTEVIAEMMRIGQVSGRRSEMMRRMLAARSNRQPEGHDVSTERPGKRPGIQDVATAQGGRPSGDSGAGVNRQRGGTDRAVANQVRTEPPVGRRLNQPKPLSPARVRRMFAPFRAAMNAAVRQQMIAISPCAAVELPRAPKIRPLAWTPAREEQFRAAVAARSRRRMTTVERQELWASAELRPSPAMVWLPEHTGRFLDSIAGHRLAALFILTVFCGLRRDEVIGLSWGDVDLDGQMLIVRATGGADGPKSDQGTRAVPVPEAAATALRAWRTAQAKERLSWGGAWHDSGLVFTREDGTPVRGQWISVTFETLAYRAGLPPVRFHDLRHGAASQYKAAGVDTKYISAMLGHARTSFTDDVYVTLFPDVARAAAEAAAAVVPARTSRDGRRT